MRPIVTSGAELFGVIVEVRVLGLAPVQHQVRALA
jgi:hypothetical protein